MGASRADRPSVMPPCDARLGRPGDARSKCRSHMTEQATAWKVRLGMPDLPADVFAGP